MDDTTPARVRLDLRDLEPPAPMVEILTALAPLAPGEVLEALLSRRPVFLLPRLEEQGHAHRLEPQGGDWLLRIVKA